MRRPPHSHGSAKSGVDPAPSHPHTHYDAASNPTFVSQTYRDRDSGFSRRPYIYIHTIYIERMCMEEGRHPREL